MAAQPTFVSFNLAEEATTEVVCSFDGGYADGFIVTQTLSSGANVKLTNGNTVAIGNQTIGTFIPIRCTQVEFAAGALVFVQAN